MFKSIKLGFLMLMLSVCLLTVACQTKEAQAAAAVMEKCRVYLEQDKVAEAGNCYRQAILTNPAAAAEITEAGTGAIFKKCQEFKDKKDFGNSIICFEGVEALRPDSANVNFQLADSYFQYYRQKIKLNNYSDQDILSKSLTAVKKSIEINPNEGIVHETYGEILKEKGDLKQALKEYEKAVQLSPEDSFYLIKLALMQEKLEKNEEAVISYEQAIKIDPNDTDAFYYLGELFERMGKLDDSIRTIERQNQLEPPNEETLQKLKMLKQKQVEKLKMKAKDN